MVGWEELERDEIADVGLERIWDELIFRLRLRMQLAISSIALRTERIFTFPTVTTCVCTVFPGPVSVRLDVGVLSWQSATCTKIMAALTNPTVVLILPLSKPRLFYIQSFAYHSRLDLCNRHHKFRDVRMRGTRSAEEGEQGTVTPFTL